jgi:hypothetical protein
VSRAPRIRATRHARRLACGHVVPAGTPVVSKGKAWLCALCEPWGVARTVAEILAAAARAGDDDDRAARAAGERHR